MKRILLTMSVALGFAFCADAQYKIPALPRSVSEGLVNPSGSLRSSSAGGQIILPPISSEELRSVEIESNEFRHFRFAVSRPIPTASEQSGQWIQTQSGKTIWRLSITSPKAKRIALTLDGYKMPEGARLFVYGSEAQSLGAFTHLNNSRDGKLQIAPCLGETITLEYEPAEGASRALPFRIEALQHAYVDPFRSTNDLAIQQKYGTAPGEPFFDLNNQTLPRLNCAGNVLRYPSSDPVSRAVVLMVSGGAVLSTGTLINNTSQDGTAYVLAAAHTINNTYEVRNLAEIRRLVASTVFYFGFESPYLDGNVRASEEKTLSGAELIAYNEEADMALLRITGLPTDPNTGIASIPDGYNAYYAGWSLSPTPQAPFVGIHHPTGSTKRYNEAEDTSIEIVDYDISEHSWTQKHWRINRWRIGTTAVGSSGSPLLDRASLVIGALSGGRSSCNSPIQDAYYAIRQTWSQSSDPFKNLAPWLDPTGSGATTCAGLDPHRTDPVHRLSDMYAREGVGFRTSKRPQASSGIGRSIVIAEGDRLSPLGVYLVFSTDANEQKSLEPIMLELSPIQNGVVQSPSWSQELSDLTFLRYDTISNSFDRGMRTMLGDTLEVYVPIVSPLTSRPLSAGQYLLSVRSKSGAALDLPLLQQGQRQTANDRQMPWSYSPTSGWNRSSSSGYGNYWLDLSVKGVRTSSGNSSGEPAETMELYYHGGKINIYMPKAGGDNARMTIYNLNGMLMLQKPLAQGENSVSVDHFTTEGVYIALIESELGKRSIKFLHLR